MSNSSTTVLRKPQANDSVIPQCQVANMVPYMILGNEHTVWLLYNKLYVDPVAQSSEWLQANKTCKMF